MKSEGKNFSRRSKAKSGGGIIFSNYIPQSRKGRQEICKVQKRSLN